MLLTIFIGLLCLQRQMLVSSENKFNLWSKTAEGRRGIAQRPQRKIFCALCVYLCVLCG